MSLKWGRVKETPPRWQIAYSPSFLIAVGLCLMGVSMLFGRASGVSDVVRLGLASANFGYQALLFLYCFAIPEERWEVRPHERKLLWPLFAIAFSLIAYYNVLMWR